MKEYRCSKCDGIIDKMAKECKHCGTKRSPCDKCGKVFLGELEFCPNCGNDFQDYQGLTEDQKIEMSGKKSKKMKLYKRFKIFKKVDLIKIFVAFSSILILTFVPYGYMEGVATHSFLKDFLDFCIFKDGQYTNILWIIWVLWIFAAIMVNEYFREDHYLPIGIAQFSIRIAISIMACISLTVAALIEIGNFGFTFNTIIPISILLFTVDIGMLAVKQFYLSPVMDKLDKPYIKLTVIMVGIMTAISGIGGLLVPNGILGWSGKMGHFRGTDCVDVGILALGESIALNGDEFDNFIAGNHTYIYYTNHYEYWISRKEKIKVEIEELSAKLLNSSDFKSDFEKIADLENDIKIINSNLNKTQNEYVKVTTKSWKKEVRGKYGKISTQYRNDVMEVIYNACAKNTVKWENKSNRMLFCEQSITLSQTQFEMGTDLAESQLWATITYYDGSIKKAYIPTSSLQSVDTQEKGVRTIQWSDDWGSYEYQISII